MESNRNQFIPTRESLLSRLRQWDDQESWHDFFNTYARLIYDVAVRSDLGDADAQEVVQETIISVAREMPGFRYNRASGSFKSWLVTIARRRTIDQFRKAARRSLDRASPFPETAAPDRVEGIEDPSVDFERIWDQEWNRHLLQMALEAVKRRVSAKQFQIYDYYVLQEFPLARITRDLGVHAGQVYLAKHRVARVLKEELNLNSAVGNSRKERKKPQEKIPL